MARWTLDKPDRLTLDGELSRLDISLIGGRLNVVGLTGPDAGPPQVQVTAIGRKPLIVSHEDGVLSIHHERPSTLPGFLWWILGVNRWYRVDVSVAVPREAAASLRMIAGSVVASGLTGGTHADVTSGRMTLLGLAGRTTARVISGPIEALGIDGDLTLETVSGEITLADSPAHRVHAKAISGSITCDLDNPHHSEIRLETTSGEITVRVREDSDLDVWLNAISGHLTTAFPGLVASDLRGSNRTVTGKLGAGTGKLRAHAISGHVALLRRDVEPDEPAEPAAEEEGR